MISLVVKYVVIEKIMSSCGIILYAVACKSLL